MDSIYLIGFMGSGKTTIANLLSKKLELPVQDTDQLVEETYQIKIKDIFKKYGEATFRNYETKVLMQTNPKDTIVSTGGGIVERDRNVDWLQEKQVIYLKTSWNVIVERLKQDTERPIWNDQNKDKQAILHRREQTYKKVATYIVETDGKTIAQIISDILAVIQH